MKIKILLFSFLCIIVIASCTTDDINPTLIEFNPSQTNLSENGGIVTLTARLNATASKQIIIPLNISGSATLESDYTLSSSQIIIEKGATEGQVVISGINDAATEAIETIIISVENTANVIQLENFTTTIQVLDDDTDTDNDGVPDADDLCPTVAGDSSNNGCPYLGFIINEVNYDPADGIAGDANGDGIRSPVEDEFIEFINHSNTSLDVSGYMIYDKVIASGVRTLRHTIPSGTILLPNKALIVFGGGTPTGNFGGATVIVDTGTAGLSLGNSGELVEIENASGTIILTFDSDALSDNPNESYTRNPDITGDFVQHTTVTQANGALFSPGRKVNGASF